MAARTRRPVVLMSLLCLWFAAVASAQQEGAPADRPDAELPVIADGPKTVDPATLLPEVLTKTATCDLPDSSLAELLDWLRDEQGVVVLLNKQALADAGILPSEPLSARLNDDPIYFVLNRLESLGLGWYFDDGIVHVAPNEAIETRLTTTPHNVGDLLDAGYETGDLVDLIESVVAPASWDSVGGAGALTSLGDVLFVGQTDHVQREVQGLLKALREHGRMTFTLDPPQHAVFREKLNDPVSVAFRDMPLETAVESLADESGLDIRLDQPALRAVRIRPREPVTLTLSDSKLQTVLEAVLMDLDLRWILRDGVLWVTSREEAEALLKTAVYDVRDLCRDADESDALLNAITVQAAPPTWDVVGGPGSIQFAKPGTMVVLHEERVLLQILDLLETYRTVLRSSKPRDRDAAREQEVITVYYRLHAAVAADLAEKLPELVAPDSWQGEADAEAPGRIVQLASPPEVIAATKGVKASSDSAEPPTVLLEQAVLRITQTRAVHREIAEVINRIQMGDPQMDLQIDAGGMGGFGGGFFALPIERPDAKK